MLSCHGTSHNSAASPYSLPSEKDATPGNGVGENEEDSSSQNHDLASQKGAVQKARASAPHSDCLDMVDIFDSNSMPAFAPSPAQSSNRRFNRKDLSISTSLTKSLHPFGMLGPQNINASNHHPSPGPTYSALHDARLIDNSTVTLPAVIMDSPLAWDAAMGLPSPSTTTGMTKSVTTSALCSSASPSRSLLQGSDVVCVGERRPARSATPMVMSKSTTVQRRPSLADSSLRRSGTTRTLGGMDENALPTPTEQEFGHIDPSSLRMSSTSTQQELAAAMMAAASLPTPVSALPVSNILFTNVDSTSSGLLAPAFAQNDPSSSLSTQSLFNPYPTDYGLPTSTSAPANLTQHGALPPSLHDGKRATTPSQVPAQQVHFLNGQHCQPPIKSQQSSTRRGSKAGRSGISKSAPLGTGYPSLPTSALSMLGAPWSSAGGATIPPALPFASPICSEHIGAGVSSSTQQFQQQQSTGVNNDLLGLHPQKQQHFKPYHGPAPCGNPDPLYEYLASPTIVPGLEIIGHDHYGNFVQVLPICPDTLCSMNQDPIYLNLLQAIYAHTIPFLDLPPCSEEESTVLLSGLSPSAIHPQSVQPPFVHLLPPKLPARGGANDPTRGWNGYYQVTLGGQIAALNNHHDGASGMQSSASLNALKALLHHTSPSSGPSLNRRASLPAFPPPSLKAGQQTLPPTAGRRSSTGSFPLQPCNNGNPNTNLNNPARKKKNMPRTHPYKVTSSHRDDNPMVMDAIMALSSSKSCGASVTGGLASFLGQSCDVPDPKRKVVEKMVHMDETEYADHYMKHQRSMRKSASTTAVSLVQTTAQSMTSKPLSSATAAAAALGTSSRQGEPQNHHVAQGSKRPQPTLETQEVHINAAATMTSNLDAMDADDFIRAMTRSQYLNSNSTLLQAPMATTPSNDLTDWMLTTTATATTVTTASAAELAELEKMMMSMDSAAVAAVQAAASATSWPKWVDFKQLEQDMCESQTGSSNHAAMDVAPSIASNSDSNGGGSETQEAPKLLLSSSTDLDMLDDPMVAEDTMAMTSLSLSDKAFSSSPNAPPSSSQSQEAQQPPLSSRQLVSGDMDCDPAAAVPFPQYQSKSNSVEMPPLPKQVCDTKPPRSSNGSLTTPPAAAPAAPQQQQQHQPSDDDDMMDSLAQPYTSSILTVLPFAPEHSRPIFPTRGARRTGWYRSKAVASRGLSAITGVDYTTTCWYNVEQLEQIIKESIAASPITEINPLDSRTLEALTDPGSAEKSTTAAKQ